MAAFMCVLAGTVVFAYGLGALPTASASASDPYCAGAYGGAPPSPGPALRFGVDPGIAGSAGGTQLPSTPDDPAKDLSAVRALVPPGRSFVVRLNRLFWSDGQAGIDAFEQQVARYTDAGLDVELQVRYHPASGQAGNIPAWVAYVRHVVDSFGINPRVVAMTITNEVNVTFSPNTSDGAYSGAQDALIAGVEAAHAEAQSKGFRQLKFGFTYAYRFSPPGDASFFSYLGTHGGPDFERVLGFVGVDFYPGTIYPPVMAPGDTYTAELAQAAGVVRDCYAPMAGIASSVPIWFTEDGVSTGGTCTVARAPTSCGLSDAKQATALSELVGAACAYARTYNITDYRWFNLRDANSSGPQTVVGPSFSAFGLLHDDYSVKPSFGTYRSLISSCGARSAPTGSRSTARRARRRSKARRRSPRHPVRTPRTPAFTVRRHSGWRPSRPVWYRPATPEVPRRPNG
jgi:hypothetical protein